MGENLKAHFCTRNSTSDLVQRSAVTIMHTQIHTQNSQAVTRRGRPAVPHSLEGSVPSMGWLALQKPLIPMWMQLMVWKDQPWENSKGGLRGDGVRGAQQHFFFLFTCFFFPKNKNYCSGKKGCPGHISPGIQTIQRLSRDGAAESWCNFYQVLWKLKTHDRRTAHRYGWGVKQWTVIVNSIIFSTLHLKLSHDYEVQVLVLKL